MDLTTIGLNIRKYRHLKKIRQDELAKKTGVSTNYIGMIERGEKIPALDTFLKLANALEVSADMLLVDVCYYNYEVKDSLFAHKLENLSSKQRTLIYDVIDAILKNTDK